MLLVALQTAHVGVGISGQEGLQAACASDYAIAQVRMELQHPFEKLQSVPSNSLHDVTALGGSPRCVKSSSPLCFPVPFSESPAARARCLELQPPYQVDSLLVLQERLPVCD